MPTTLHENRPSAGIGVVEVQKPMVFCDFCGARATLCGDRRGRGAKTHGFLRFPTCPRDPLRGSAWSRCKNSWFLRFLKFPRDPLRGSARCKNSWFFAISKVLARPSAGIGVVEVQKPMGFFLRFLRCSRDPLLFCDWSSGVVSWFARLLPEPEGRGFDSSLVRGRASQDATCILKQLAQSNLRRASCTEQHAQTNLHRPVCADRLA